MTERIQEWRMNLYLNMWWPPKHLWWKIQRRIEKCDGCGRRFRVKHYSSGIHYIEPWVQDPPTRQYCDVACARLPSDDSNSESR